MNETKIAVENKIDQLLKAYVYFGEIYLTLVDALHDKGYAIFEDERGDYFIVRDHERVITGRFPEVFRKALELIANPG